MMKKLVHYSTYMEKKKKWDMSNAHCMQEYLEYYLLYNAKLSIECAWMGWKDALKLK